MTEARTSERRVNEVRASIRRRFERLRVPGVADRPQRIARIRQELGALRNELLAALPEVRASQRRGTDQDPARLAGQLLPQLRWARRQADRIPRDRAPP